MNHIFTSNCKSEHVAEDATGRRGGSLAKVAYNANVAENANVAGNANLAHIANFANITIVARNANARDDRLMQDSRASGNLAEQQLQSSVPSILVD